VRRKGNQRQSLKRGDKNRRGASNEVRRKSINYGEVRTIPARWGAKKNNKTKGVPTDKRASSLRKKKKTERSQLWRVILEIRAQKEGWLPGVDGQSQSLVGEVFGI